MTIQFGKASLSSENPLTGTYTAIPWEELREASDIRMYPVETTGRSAERPTESSDPENESLESSEIE